MKKEKNIHIRVTEDQHDQLMRAARREGLTISAFIIEMFKQRKAK